MSVRLTRRDLLFAAVALPAAAQKKAEAKPNLVLIVLEDVGARMLGCYGNREIRTPALDLLARTGSRFLNCYSASAVAAPGRASLLSGRSPRQLGFRGDTSGALPQDSMLIDVLAGAGYQCGYAGGWGLSPAQSPRGAKMWETASDAGTATAKAAQFLDAQKPGQPFFLTVNYSLDASAAPSKYLDQYANVRFDTIGWEPASPRAAAFKEPLADIVGNIRKAAAAITAIDDQVGAIVGRLDARGLRDDTLVIVTATNGSFLGRHGLWGDGRATNPPSLYEEVVAVPLIWQWTRRVPPEGARPEIVSGYDLFPTVCDLAGVEPPAGVKLPGRSYLAAATNQPFPKREPWRSLVFAEFGGTVMVRDKRYKLILRDGGKGPNELYDEVSDRGEKVNQLDNLQFLTIREGLATEIEAWLKTL